MSQAPPGPEVHTLLDQQHTDRYNPVKKDAPIYQLDHGYGKPSLTTGFADFNPFTGLAAVSFEELQRKMPRRKSAGFKSGAYSGQIPKY